MVPLKSGVVFPAVAAARHQGSAVRLVVPVRALDFMLFANLLEWQGVVDAVIANNVLLHRALTELLSLPPERLHHVRQAARDAVGPHDTSRFGSSALPLRIAYVGRLEQPAKRVLDAIPFAGRLVQQGVPFELHFFGAGSCEAELAAALAGLGVAAAFHGYVPPRDLPAACYRTVDVIVLFSSSEGSPNVVCEAKRYGVVPIVTRYPGLAEEAIVEDGVTGCTFAVGDVDAAAAHVARLSADRPLLERLANAAIADERKHPAEAMHRQWGRIIALAADLPPWAAVPALRDVHRPAGVFDRVMGPRIGHALRRLTGRRYRHVDGGGEWPAFEPAAPATMARVAEVLSRITGLP